MNDNKESRPGLATDSKGEPVIDPTKNVLDLVSAAIQRQDDLRAMSSEHVKEIANLRATYDEKLRQAESARIDAIRAVDVGNVQRAAEVQATQALTLATQVTTSADALRAQVEATRQQTADALRNALEPIQKRIDDLTRVQYEGVGQKTQIVETSTKTSVGANVVMAALFGLSTVVAIIAVAVAVLKP